MKALFCWMMVSLFGGSMVFGSVIGVVKADETVSAVAIAEDRTVLLLATVTGHSTLLIDGLSRRSVGEYASIGPDARRVVHVEDGVLVMDEIAEERARTILFEEGESVEATAILSEKGAGVVLVQTSGRIRLFFGTLEAYQIEVEGVLQSARESIIWTEDETGLIRGYDLGGFELVDGRGLCLFTGGLECLDGEQLREFTYEDGKLESRALGVLADGFIGAWSGHIVRRSGAVVRALPYPSIK